MGHNKAIVFFIFCFSDFFSQKVRVVGQNKNKMHLDHFPIELKLKETQIVFPSILIHLESGPNEFILPIKMAISHQVLSLWVI